MHGVVPTELNRLTTRSRQRGFTLVEIAIAMVVIGLLLGATAVTSRHLEEKRQLQREMQRLEIVRDAIVGYAIRNRTRERILKVVPWFGPGEWEFRLPAGRPYLPCPDWDGDGYEDRVPQWAFPQGVEVNPDLAVTVTIGELAPPWRESITWTQDLGSSPEAFPYGECRVSRGTVPWRTLGVAPSDGWGNQHTYFADPVFSNAIFGFDRQTVADIYDPRVPSAPGYGASPRHFKYPIPDVIGRDILTAPPPTRPIVSSGDNRGCPAAICIGNDSCEPTQQRISHRDPRRCAWRLSADSDNPTIFKGGLVAAKEIPGRKHYPPGGVMDGLPFVLVSHGPNGRYAVNHWATLHNRTRGFRDFAFPICNPAWQSVGGIPGLSEIPAEDRVQHFETANATRITSANIADISCPPTTGTFLGVENRTLYNTASFVWQPPGIGDKSDFDDLLVWHTRGELTRSIRGNIPRLPKMQFAYFPPDFP